MSSVYTQTMEGLLLEQRMINRDLKTVTDSSRRFALKRRLRIVEAVIPPLKRLIDDAGN